MRAEMDVLALISNCPQLNNPCNAYNPTPMEVLIWDGQDELMFRKVLIANRGRDRLPHHPDPAEMGIGSVAVYSEADRHSLHVQQADEAVLIGPPPARKLSVDGGDPRGGAETGAEAIHPGYGFLSENADFAEACADSGIVFIGPTPEQMRAFGLKHTARAMARECGVPLLPGTGSAGGRAGSGGGGRADRLSGDAQEHGGRRRHRHAAVPDSGGTRGMRTRPWNR